MEAGGAGGRAFIAAWLYTVCEKVGAAEGRRGRVSKGEERSRGRGTVVGDSEVGWSCEPGVVTDGVGLLRRRGQFQELKGRARRMDRGDGV